jgi:NAD(P)-dependent dehydrogenase (short-subunit alcohol dehydrogenase family)
MARSGRPHAASKAGVAGMTLPLARRLARNGIRVMTIAPGVFETPMAAQITEIAQALAKAVPFHRGSAAGGICALVRQIVENVMLNGEVIRLDGRVRMAPVAMSVGTRPPRSDEPAREEDVSRADYLPQRAARRSPQP